MFSYFQRLGKALMFPIAVLPAAALLLGMGYFIQNQIPEPVTYINGAEVRVVEGMNVTVLSSNPDLKIEERKDGSFTLTNINDETVVGVINAAEDGILGTEDDIRLSEEVYIDKDFPSPVVVEQEPMYDFLNTLQLFLQKAGGALIDSMGLLFAIGIAFGLSKDGSGAAALAGLVSWLVVQNIAGATDGSFLTALSNTNDMITADYIQPFTKINNQFIGILIGALTAFVYNKSYKVELPPALSFFSGRRLSVILVTLMSLVLSGVLIFVWPVVYNALIFIGESLLNLGPIGAGVFGTANRLLIPLGLHHALNSVFWFDVAGIDDIGRFLGTTSLTTDVPLAGYMPGWYQAGFFPIMMFGLPAASFAMIKNARPKQKKRVKGILLAGAIAAFFTGITEPLEFAFMFVSFPLYVVHAILTGISMFVAANFGWLSGFGFSAGLIDYVLSYSNPNAVNAIMLLVQGVVFAVIYFVVFSFAIKKFNLLTPGRDPKEDDLVEDEIEKEAGSTGNKYTKQANIILDAIGKDNIVIIDNCATRLRIDVKDSSIIDEVKIKSTGVSGILKPSATSVQIIVGPTVQFLADEMNNNK